MDRKKYNAGRRYARWVLNNRQKWDITRLITAVDDYRFFACYLQNSFELGIADQLWQWVLEKDYEAAS